MAKKLPDDRMEHFLSRSTKARQTPHDIPTKDPQGATETPHKEVLKKYHIRFQEADWKKLQAYFERKGLSVSSGIRMIVSEFMEREGLK